MSGFSVQLLLYVHVLHVYLHGALLLQQFCSFGLGGKELCFLDVVSCVLAQEFPFHALSCRQVFLLEWCCLLVKLPFRFAEVPLTGKVEVCFVCV